jgi:hypothetical protein
MNLNRADGGGLGDRDNKLHNRAESKLLVELNGATKAIASSNS